MTIKKYATATEYEDDVEKLLAAANLYITALENTIRALDDVHYNAFQSIVWDQSKNGIRHNENFDSYSVHVYGRQMSGAKTARRMINEIRRMIRGNA